MMRISKLADYGLVLMTHLARDSELTGATARDLSRAARVPLPTVSKLLKVLSRAELLVSQRGAKGGYRLARAPADITIAEVLGAIEGPIGLTDCTRDPGCRLEGMCPTRGHWGRIAATVRDALEKLRLSDMAGPLTAAKPAAAAPVRGASGREAGAAGLAAAEQGA